MKRVLFLISALIISVTARSQESLKARMDRIEADFSVSFVYGSAVTPESVMVGEDYGNTLGEALGNSFAGTGIKYEIRKRNIILTREIKTSRLTVCGYVTDRDDGETLIGAAVIAGRDGRTPVGTVSNEYGFYTLSLPEGDYVLEVSYIGYAAEHLHLSLKSDVNIDVPLARDAVIAAASITSGREAGPESPRPGSHIIPSMMLDHTATVLGETDVLKTIQFLPGVQNATDGFSGINVRGGGFDENLILLDGSALYNTNHFLGFTSVFPPEMVKKVTMYKAAFPARYGGRISSVVDVRSKDGSMKEPHALVSIGLLSDRLYVDGPVIKDKLSLAVSGRLMQTAAVSPVMKAFDVPANYWFYDVNAKMTWAAGEKDRLYVGFFSGKDVFGYDRTQTGHEQYCDGNDDVHNRYSSNRDIIDLNWGNTLGTLRWNHIYSPRLFSNLTIAANRYTMDLENGNESSLDEDGMKTGSISSFRMFSGIRDLHTRLDCDYTPVPEHIIHFGAELTGRRFCPESSFNNETSVTDDLPTESVNTEIKGGREYLGCETSLYLEDNMEIGRYLTLCPGIRLSAYWADGLARFNPEPRLSLKASIYGGLSAKLSATRMAQYIHMLASGNISLPTDMWVPVTRDIKPMVSDQFCAGIYYAAGKGWNLSLEGYWKTADNVLEYIDANPSVFAVVDWESNVAMGEGRSYGLEFLFEKTSGRATGMLSYTLSRSDRIFPDGSINNGKRFPYTYDHRHKVNAMFNYVFSGRVDVTACFTFASGSWFTLPTRYAIARYAQDDVLRYNNVLCVTERNNYRLPPVHHLDIGVNFHKKKECGERILNLGVYNVYGAHNQIFVSACANGDHLYKNPDYPDGVVLIDLRSAFLFLPSFNYIRKF